MLPCDKNVFCLHYAHLPESVWDGKLIKVASRGPVKNIATSLNRYFHSVWDTLKKIANVRILLERVVCACVLACFRKRTHTVFALAAV
jgi:hypothetical protein